MSLIVHVCLIFPGTLEKRLGYKLCNEPLGRDTICMVPYYSANRNVQTWNQSPTNKSLSLSGQGSMVCEQIPVAVDAIQSRNKTVPRRVDPVGDWKWHYSRKRVDTQGSMVDMLYLLANLMTIVYCFIYSLRYGAHITTWTEISWSWVMDM